MIYTVIVQLRNKEKIGKVCYTFGETLDYQSKMHHKHDVVRISVEEHHNVDKAGLWLDIYADNPKN